MADEKSADSTSNLLTIYNAYVSYYNDNKAAPASQEDLVRYLDSESTDAIFMSPRDNKPFKIYWGTPIELASRTDDVIVAHEQDGADGRRYLMTCFGISQMTDKEFAEAGLPQN